MSPWLSRLTIPFTAILLLASPGLLPAQEPAAKAAPQRLVLTTSVPDARPAFDAALVELLNIGGARADAQIRRALQLDPTSGMIRGVYAQWATGLTPAQRLSELDRAVADAARASTPELLTVVSMREWVRGDVKSAMAIMKPARAMAPDDPFLAFLDFQAHSAAGSAQADLTSIAREFVERNPGEASMYNFLGYSLFRGGKETEGLDAIRRYAELLPNHPNSHDSYAELLQWSGKLDDAEREYRRAIELDPGFSEAYNGLAEVAQLRHDYKGAQVRYEAGLAHATDATARIATMRAIAYTAVFAGDMKTARTQLLAAAAEADKAGMAASAGWSHAYLADFEAADGNAKAAAEQLAAAKALPAWALALNAAIVHASLANSAALHDDVTALERESARTPAVPKDALPLVRVMQATVAGDVATAKAGATKLVVPAYRAFGQAFLLRAARSAGDAATVKAAQAEIAGYRPVDATSAFVNRLIRK